MRSAWGVCVARSDISGNAKALHSGASDEASAPRLSQNYILLMLIINMLQMVV